MYLDVHGNFLQITYTVASRRIWVGKVSMVAEWGQAEATGHMALIHTQSLCGHRPHGSMAI